ncbi:RES domain-containing protein [Solimonas sp. K1W22B-7]|uniref:RES family NAD+ phosphorylase n=1 Tax=Solimonas sp. K1W22B-7 TaxID=2303331 RepID=UPI000E336D74|nr:RES family NAD+ phosphorylase [Solimonas sp. K1W22B-7]AXQ27606.1 RES domain-containing protein [Solimonas sp. K1W22B-7]
MILWRIATESKEFPANDLGGGGAAKFPGRWNAEKQFVLYTAPTIALAVLETTAHLDTGGFPLNKFLLKLEVPDDDWNARTIFTPDMLSASWCAIPHGVTSVEASSKWYAGKSTLLLQVPSVIVPEEANILINCKHRRWKKISAAVIRRFEYDLLLRSR